MKTQHRYSNPRIDSLSVAGDASKGQVHFEPIKAIWLTTMILFGTIGSVLTISISAIILFVGFTAVTLCLGHSLGMHRRFIHRSYLCPKWMEYLFVHLGVLVGLAGPLGMLRTHDLRDWAQRQSNCHDYFSHGKAWKHDAYWQLFCSINLDAPPEFVPEPEIANDAFYTFMERTWMLQQLPWALAFFLIGGWSWVFWGICSRVSVSVIGHWMIGYFAHNSGDRDWHVEGAAVQGFNIPFFALLTMGESWHNNHHAFPNSAKLGLKSNQPDPGWLVLLILEKIGLVSNLVTPEDLMVRTELKRLRHATE